MTIQCQGMAQCSPGTHTTSGDWSTLDEEVVEANTIRSVKSTGDAIEPWRPGIIKTG